MRILIADDDPTSRELLTGVLTMQGHELRVTGDGHEAWEVLVGEAPPRLAIVDWMMPVLDGIGLLRRLRAREAERDLPPTYVIMLTARGATEDVARGLDAGADDYLTKPFEPIELRARVRAGQRLIERDDALREARDQVRTLRGIVPICMHCKKIRTDDEYWQEVEQYVQAHTDAVFSHGLCPTCLEVHYPHVPKE